MNTTAITPEDIEISCGSITYNGEEVGTANHDLKHGYHPAVLLKLTGHDDIWVELDTKDLVGYIKKRTVQALTGTDGNKQEEVYQEARSTITIRQKLRKGLWPSLYDEDAAKAEKNEEWHKAAVLWRCAAMASRGSGRRQRYEAASVRCIEHI